MVSVSLKFVFGFLITVAALIFLSTATSVFRNCGSKKGKVIDFKLPGCTIDDKSRCILARNTTKAIELTFQTFTRMEKIEATAYGIISGVSMAFPMPHNNACLQQGGSVKCPVVPGQNYTYRKEIFIDPNFPNLTLTVKWVLSESTQSNDLNDRVACILTPVKIADEPVKTST